MENTKPSEANRKATTAINQQIVATVYSRARLNNDTIFLFLLEILVVLCFKKNVEI